MDDDTARRLRRLLERRPVAALGTLHRGEPAVSMVPFVLPRGGISLIIHVSALATHTRDMQEHPRVSLLVMAEPDDATPPQALPRVALQADAAMLPREGAALPGAEARRPGHPPRRDLRAARPQRRRQDHADQRRLRHRQCQQRQRAPSTATTSCATTAPRAR
jgi:putative heme iron utilization protein